MKLTHKIIATILLSLSCGSVATAQSVTLSVERCREMAIENNFNLKSSNLAILQSEDIYSQYRSNFFPKISLSASYLYSTASLDYTIEGCYLPTYVVDGTTGELVANVAGVAADGSYIFNQYAYMPDQLFEFSIGSVFNTGVSLTQPIYLGGK
ncbi:MAG: TolC family protein, partial [Rikenellaceae bacterium]